jgi:hypothetical protein
MTEKSASARQFEHWYHYTMHPEKVKNNYIKYVLLKLLRSLKCKAHRVMTVN